MAVDLSIIPHQTNPDFYKMDRKLSFNMDAFYSFGEKQNVAMFMATLLFYKTHKANVNIFGMYEVDESYFQEMGLNLGRLREKLPLLKLEQFRELTSPLFSFFLGKNLSSEEIEALLQQGREAVKQKYQELFPESELPNKLDKSRLDHVYKLIDSLYNSYEKAAENNVLFDTVWQDAIYLLTKKFDLVRKYVNFDNQLETSLSRMSIIESANLISRKGKGKPKKLIEFRLSNEARNGLESNFFYLDFNIIRPLLAHNSKSLLPLATYLLDVREVSLAKNEDATPNFQLLCDVADLNGLKNQFDKKGKLNKYLKELNNLYPNFFPYTWVKPPNSKYAYQLVLNFRSTENENKIKKWLTISDNWINKMSNDLRNYFIEKYNVTEEAVERLEKFKKSNASKSDYVAPSLSSVEGDILKERVGEEEVNAMKHKILENPEWDYYLMEYVQKAFELSADKDWLKRYFSYHKVKESLLKLKTNQVECLIKLNKFLEGFSAK